MTHVLGRRVLLRATGAATVATAIGGALTAGAVQAEADSLAFAHGVASGDPLPDSVLLWTRVTPTPDAVPGSGAGPTVEVGWEVAADPAFAAVLRSGSVTTGPDHDHTVKVEVGGLSPAATYYYRFRLGTQVSAAGTTRTAPATEAAVSRLRFGVVSCSNWQSGYFAAYRHLAERGDLDAVIHLGDYLYEYGPGQFPIGYDIRPHVPAREALTLADYRKRHAQYKSDPDLQRLHRTCPWIITWDDHEVANDAWSGGAQNHQPNEGAWAARRAAAYQAYFEWMPVRNAGDRLYRRLRFGRLAELSMLDLRSYRSQQVSVGSGQVDDPARTIAGTQQMNWLVAGLTTSTAQWKLVGNPVMISPVAVPPLPRELTGPLLTLLGLPAEGIAAFTDQWDGYTADRLRILRALRDNGIHDAVFLTGDIHSSWACDLPYDAGTYPFSPSVGTELVCPPATSDNIDDLLHVAPRTVSPVIEAAIMALNWHVRWVEYDSHGAAVLEVTPDAVQMDWYFLADRANPASAMSYARSYRVRTGTQRVGRVYTPITP
jgi:alkaline phosphatase D